MIRKGVCIVILLASCLYNVAFAFDNEMTHPDITENAIYNSNLENYLIQNLGFKMGLRTKFSSNNEKTILYWLRKGSTDEDYDTPDSFTFLPQCRAVNHFHNPLLPWDQSYMTDQPWWVDAWCWDWKPIYSNITWATTYLSPPPDGAKVPFTYFSSMSPYTWDRARDYYYKALTLTTEEDREIYFAWTFQTVGHIIHLLEDMAVPAHTRNDFQSHYIRNNNSFFDRIQPFEHYVKANPAIVASATPAAYDFPSFTNPRLTDYWDTNLYNGNNPSTLNDIGLAEFSNANYFSDFTIRDNNPEQEHFFDYPYINGTIQIISAYDFLLFSNDYQICYDFEHNSTDIRKYISRQSKGACPGPSSQRNADHFAVPSLLFTSDTAYLEFSLDDNVHNTYAKELIPRAVGYSAGLLNYFFRGTIEITPPDKYVYSITDGSQTPYTYIDENNFIFLHQEFTHIKVNLRDATPDAMPGEGIKDGTLQAWAIYKKRTDYQPDLSADPPTPDQVEEDFSYSVSEPIPISSLSSEEPTEFTFDFSGDPQDPLNYLNHIPAGITDLSLQIVFKGTIGNEEDIAVAAGFKDLMEPTHLVIWNLTDMFSLYVENKFGDVFHLYTSNDNPYTPELVDGIRNTPELAEEVDFDDDGVFNELIIGEPYIDPHNVSYDFQFMSESPPSETPVSSAIVNNLPDGRPNTGSAI